MYCMINKYISYKSLTNFLQILQKLEFLQIVRNVRKLLDGNILNHRKIYCFSYKLTVFHPLLLNLSIIIKKTRK